MKNIDKKLLFPLLAVESESGDTDAMRDHVGGVLSTMAGVSWVVDEWGNIIASKGEGAYPPCIVAHLDTVHDITGHGIHVVEHGLKNSPSAWGSPQTEVLCLDCC